MSMRTLAESVAVITGAGSGIGRALAVAFSARGADLALADLDDASLAATRASLPSAGKVSLHRVDVAKLDEMTRLRDEVVRDHGRASILINNAGVALYGAVEHVSFADLEWIMAINFWGAVYGCKLFLPLLRREAQANIVNISSLFGIIAPPLQAGYSASKFALRGFSEALRHELAAGSNVRLTVVHPGGIKTNISASTRRGAHADNAAFERDTKAFARSLVMAPDRAAALITGAVLTDKPRLIIGRDAEFLEKLQRLFPAQYMKILTPLFNRRGPVARGGKAT